MKKRLFAMLLVVVLTLSLVSTAFAAQGTNTNTGSGSITITNAVQGKTYDIYRIFNLTGVDTSDPANGEYDSYAYTVNTDWVGFFFGTGAAGASYLVEKTSGNTATYQNCNELTYNGKTYFINITEDNVAELAQDALPYAVALTNSDGTQEAENDGRLVFNDIALGYYLVYPQGATDIAENYSSICSLTSTSPDVEVEQKADYPDIEKVDDKEDVEIGETVNYTITGQVPDTTGYTSYTYKINDTMSAGLTFSKNVTVKFDDDVIAVTNITDLDETGIEALTAAEKAATIKYAGNGFELYFDMTKYQANVGDTITVTYSAVVNESAVATKTVNNATLTYSNNPNDVTSTETTPPDIEHVWTSEIVIDKYDGSDAEKKLSGAKFALMNTDGKFYNIATNAVSGEAEVTWVEVGNTSIALDGGNAYSVSSATVTALLASENITTVTTDANGAASFEGLKDGTYYLVEIESPTGYNLLDSCVAVIVTGAVPEGADDNITVGVSVTSQVANNTGTVLPSTGGIGTTIFYVVGGVLVAGAIVLFVTKRRMAARG